MWSGGGGGMDPRERVVGLACREVVSTESSKDVEGGHTSKQSLSGSEPLERRPDFLCSNSPQAAVLAPLVSPQYESFGENLEVRRPLSGRRN